MINNISKYLVNIKKCDEEQFVSQGCGTSYPVRRYNGSVLWDNMGYDKSCLVLNNGTYLCFYSYIATFDVNGSKAPNQIGTDVFAALVDRDNYMLYPAIGYRSGWGAADGKLVSPSEGNGSCEAAAGGWGCSAWYLMHDK